MKKITLILIVFINTNYVFSQCTLVTGIHTTNIKYNNADVNWNYQNNIYNYKIRYKIVGDTIWSWKLSNYFGW